MICPAFCGGAALAFADAIVAGPNNRQMENAVDQQHSFNAALERPGCDPATSMQAMIRPPWQGTLQMGIEPRRTLGRGGT